MILLISVAIIAWGLFSYMAIPDSDRHWDLGVLRDVPSQSIYSSTEPEEEPQVPTQFEPLPEGTPIDKEATKPEKGLQPRAAEGNP